MPYYKNINTLLIHIPKTGGTSLEEYLQTKSPQTLFSGYTNDIMPEEHLRNISLQHQFFSDIWRYRNILQIDFTNIKIITIVRNPYDRIISDLLYLNLIKHTTHPDKISSIIKKYIQRTDLDNHNVPQYKFICDSKGNLSKNMAQIKIFKTETLTKELQEYGFIDYKGKNTAANYIQYLNKDSIKLINNFYQVDFLIFGYTMI